MAASRVTLRLFMAWHNPTDTVPAGLHTKLACLVLLLFSSQIRKPSLEDARVCSGQKGNAFCCVLISTLGMADGRVCACGEAPVSLRLLTGHPRARWLLDCGYANSSLGPEATVHLCT